MDFIRLFIRVLIFRCIFVHSKVIKEPFGFSIFNRLNEENKMLYTD